MSQGATKAALHLLQPIHDIPATLMVGPTHFSHEAQNQAHALSSANILIVDEGRQLGRALRSALVFEGYLAVEARTVDEGLDLIRSEHIDLILLDVTQAGPSGVESCRDLRSWADVPIIVVAACSTEHDKVRAFEAGADGYVVKPFGTEELMARIRATLRRFMNTESPQWFVSSDLTIDLDRRLVTLNGQRVHLTPKEFDLLRYLMAHHGKPVSHRQVLQAVWGPAYGDEREPLRVTINQLRKKIEPDAHHPRYVHTEPWVGYRFEALPEKARAGHRIAPRLAKRTESDLNRRSSAGR